MNELSVIHGIPYAGHRWSAFSRRPVSGKSEIEFYLRKLLGMVEEILSTAQLHRHLLDEPSQINSDTPVANAQNFGYN